ncbi:MAG: ribosome biogenesis GTP-binding protein YihA/YsxC [Acidobacteriota bacterium]|nr:ribosome biogenesis GTP-binding protein YihA/YsxC [Acidobacteriota bacterium]
MKITGAEFIKSAFDEKDWPKSGLPEIAFLGRSNVGKSSLINSLLGVKGLARTSSTPGRTQALNFFLINKRFHFVDLPGYGYARVPRAVRESWGEIVTGYLAKRERLVLSIQIVDSRHEPTTLDMQLHEWLSAYAKPHVVVATKADKLSQNELRRNIGRARQIFGAQDGPGEVVAYSAVSGHGREQVWRAITEALTVSQIPF